MKHLRILGILAMMALLVLGATGCSETTQINDEMAAADEFETMDMNKAYGGLTLTDETDAFGDDYYTETENEYEDDASDDPLQLDPEVLAYEDEVVNGDPTTPNRPKITVVKLLWGQLDGLVEDIDESFDVLDWSGMVSVDRGIAVVRRVILFERPYDHLVYPRIDRQTIAFMSHTGPHFDGLIIEIIEPPLNDDDPSDRPEVNMLHIATQQINLDFAMVDVNGLDEIYPVDEMGNALRIEGHLLTDLDLCPKGFLAGIWVARPLVDADGTVLADGFFKGRWVNLWGSMMGYLRGRYGVNDAGENVFFGKYINRGGQFRGILAGNYGPNAETGRGEFHGNWINAAETVEGVLGGQYVQIPDRPGGFFSGRWATLCDPEAIDTLK
ncbi:hypothetical protein H8E07_01965 [bacterium]|nr:hypothetical protein [bacterium]